MNRDNNSNNIVINNNRFEESFRKVFKNKLLVKLIFHFIKTVKWIKYSDHSKISAFNRITFKDIKSLKFIIEHKLFALLKCKLEAPFESYEFINTDTNSVKDLLNLYKKGDLKSKLIEINNTNFPQLFIKLLNNNSNNKLHIPSLLKRAITLELADIVKVILFNGNFIINNSLESQWVDDAIEFNSPSIVDSLINSKSIKISNETKNTSLIKASKNKDHFEEMIKLIINNKLYNNTTTGPPYYWIDFHFV